MRPFAVLLIILSSIVALSSHGEESRKSVIPPWIVKVSSVFPIDESERKVTVTGTGTLVQIGSRYFVLCDSHLSQGTSGIEIEHPEKGKLRIKPTQRFARNRDDLELIEIAPPEVGEVFRWSAESRKFQVSPDSIEDWEYFERFPVAGHRYVVPDVPWSAGNPRPWTKHPQMKKTHIADAIFETLDPASSSGKLVTNYSGDSIIADAGIRPGESGSPMLQRSEGSSNKVALIGLAKGYHRYFDHSYFSTPEQIADLVDAFEKGRRGRSDATTWRFGRFTYLDFGNGTKETSDGFQPSGEYSVQDAGNGTSGDAGNGTSGDAGNSISGDATIRQGMVYRGKPIIGFRIQDGKRPIALYADPAGLRMAEALIKKGKKVDPIPLGSDLTDLLRSKVASTPSNPKSSRHFELPLPSGACAVDLEAFKEGELRIRLPYDPKVDKGKPVVLVLPARVTPSYLRFKSSSGESYTIDTRGLYFATLSTIAKPDSTLFESLGETFGSRMYITMQKGAYQTDTFPCYPTKAFSDFTSSEKITLQEIRGRAFSSPCPVAIEPVGTVIDLTETIGDVLKNIPESAEKKEALYVGQVENTPYKLEIDLETGKRSFVFGKQRFNEGTGTRSYVFAGAAGDSDFSDLVYFIPDAAKAPRSIFLEFDEYFSERSQVISNHVQRRGCSDQPLWKEKAVLVRIYYTYVRNVSVYCLNKAGTEK